MPETFESDGRFFQRTGKRVRIVQVGQWYLGQAAYPNMPIMCRTAPGNFGDEGRELLIEVPAPPAVQGEPGEAVRELAADISQKVYGHEDDLRGEFLAEMISAHLAPLLAKARAVFASEPEMSLAARRELLDAYKAELTRWEPKT